MRELNYTPEQVNWSPMCTKCGATVDYDDMDVVVENGRVTHTDCLLENQSLFDSYEEE